MPVDEARRTNGDGPDQPSAETIRTAPTPAVAAVFIYVSTKATARPRLTEVRRVLLKNADELARESLGYVGSGIPIYAMILDRFTERTVGSVFAAKNTVGVTIDQLLAGAESGK